ncbi:MAG: head GIN domain-containing protein [Cytophagaceae bacterium]
MKKIILYHCYVFLIILSFSGCNNCRQGSGNITTMSRPVNSFNSIKIDGSFFVTLRKDTVSKVEVITDENLQSDVLTYVYGNTLTVETNSERCIRKASIMHITISAPSFNKIELRGSGNITGLDTIPGDYLQVVSEGSGDITLTAKAIDINVSIRGSGHTELYGTTASLSEKIDGSGSIQAFGLNASTANANITGSGLIETRVSSTLNASVNGSGNITYAGNPTVSSHVKGSGSVTHQ